MGYHTLHTSDDFADHGDILYSPVHQQRDLVFQHHSDSSGNERSCCGNLCRRQRSRRQGRADLQARQLQAGSRGRNRSAKDRRSRCRNWWLAKADIDKADAQIEEAKASYQQAIDELETKLELRRRNSGTVAEREIERLQVLAEGRKAAVTAATATKDAAEARLATQLPAEKASAEAALAQAEVELAKTTVTRRRQRPCRAVRAAGRRRGKSPRCGRPGC